MREALSLLVLGLFVGLPLATSRPDSAEIERSMTIIVPQKSGRVTPSVHVVSDSHESIGNDWSPALTYRAAARSYAAVPVDTHGAADLEFVGYSAFMITIGSIVLRVDDLERQTAFWMAALEYLPR